MLTMFMLSGCQEKKSARRQPGDKRLTGLGFAECTRSGNCAPSRTKNTCREDSATVAPRSSHHFCLCYEHSSDYVCSSLIHCRQGMLQRRPRPEELCCEVSYLARQMSAHRCPGAGSVGRR